MIVRRTSYFVLSAALIVVAVRAQDAARLEMQCYGIGPAVDLEDGPKGFGMHSDQERLLERELYRFVQLTYEVVLDLARPR